MHHLSSKPNEAYRRVDLDARIEASSGQNLTLICLEEAVGALNQALIALDRRPGSRPTEALVRAHGIAVWLTRNVDQNSPLHTQLVDFYGGLAAVISHNIRRPSTVEITSVRQDFDDLIAASKAA